jgi:hypothetical protein
MTSIEMGLLKKKEKVFCMQDDQKEKKSLRYCPAFQGKWSTYFDWINARPFSTEREM